MSFSNFSSKRHWFSKVWKNLLFILQWINKISRKKINITKKMRFTKLNTTVVFVYPFFEKKKFRLGLESGQYFYPFSSREALIWSMCSITKDHLHIYGMVDVFQYFFFLNETSWKIERRASHYYPRSASVTIVIDIKLDFRVFQDKTLKNVLKRVMFLSGFPIW